MSVGPRSPGHSTNIHAYNFFFFFFSSVCVQDRLIIVRYPICHQISITNRKRSRLLYDINPTCHLLLITCPIQRFHRYVLPILRGTEGTAAYPSWCTYAPGVIARLLLGRRKESEPIAIMKSEYYCRRNTGCFRRPYHCPLSIILFVAQETPH